MHALVRRFGLSVVASVALVSSLSPAVAHIAAAQSVPSTIGIGINLPFTGADAADAANIRDGAPSR
jgi:hydrogenase/urease accessory protein HupE